MFLNTIQNDFILFKVICNVLIQYYVIWIINYFCIINDKNVWWENKIQTSILDLLKA